MVKCVFLMPLICLQGFINSVSKRTQQPLPCPHHSCIRKRTKMINVTFKYHILCGLNKP
ncbi:Mobile element protein [Candidatus Enterovibrio altilux]|uniref:Mobile element protein n=1 Tax=Candidatus Enterovibrio altilux TaxID=1927128 RepID=A0A291BBE7_9GAMM|nr:Mobile element protein [Candidatus Enterovibrio luxaltus]